MQKLFTILVTVVALSLPACDFDAAVDAVDRFDLIIQLEPIESFAIGQITDAVTGDLVHSDAKVSVSGRDRDYVVDFYGDNVQEVRARSGMFTLGVQPGLSPSKSAPIQFALTVDVPGYERGYATIEFTEVGERPIRISLVPENAQIEGAATGSASATSGESLQVSANGSDMAAEVSVPAASWRRADGSSASGDIHARVRYHGVGSKAASGLPVPVLDSGEAFAPLGVVTLDFRDGTGTFVEADADAAVRMSIPNHAVNPETGVPFQPGDAIQVAGFDPRTGSWSVIGEAKLEVAADKAGQKGWIMPTVRGYSMVAPSIFPQSSPFRLDIVRNGHAGLINVSLSSPTWPMLHAHRVRPGESTVETDQAYFPVSYSLHLPDGTVYSGSTMDATHVVTLPAAQKAGSDVTFEVDLSCTLKLQPPFNAALYYRLASGSGAGDSAGVPTWKTDAYGRVTGGTLTIPGMLVGERYRFTLVTPEETGWEEIDITSTSMRYEADVPIDLCVK
jgi:hypothetical protein